MKQTKNKKTEKKEYDGVLPEHEAHLGAFMQDIGYEFKNRALLHLALTHCSYNGKVGENNQRLEFLGDAVLSSAKSCMPKARQRKGI